MSPHRRRFARLVRTLFASLVLACIFAGLAHARPAFVAGDPPYLERESVQQFIDEMVSEGFERRQLEALFREVQPQQRVLDLISAPAEARPWYRYHPIFLTDQRIEGGARFWAENESLLARAEEEFDVEASIIVSIIGVETFYGRNQGGFRVLDSLVTLGFDYPPRSRFFRSELAHFLRLAREEGLDLQETRGSYAGAMGRGQFISSSYREYAVDFSGDGRRDLIGSWADAIGSVANYFRRHGWNYGEPVVARARAEGDDYRQLMGGGFQARHSLEDLARHGVTPVDSVPEDGRFSLIELQTEEGREVWLGYPNFYVITRYNRSPLYAKVVYLLAEEISRAKSN
ncbi:lytic murein transglycosylase B [Thioalkalivibrio denitrificans]|uniref:Lytic murein transglycosylase B n=1 Tax=Thioalkalivibrio denitrificans TaxID=108003 RepID=A0A1V3NI27_9GAMM|nr:lytic murein transglycosylase B [Thioalkalivibrio denitrificans]OOG24759.1 lytic murein transglycosylase B [Thioalkalivibrio denitrificans]